MRICTPSAKLVPLSMYVGKNFPNASAKERKSSIKYLKEARGWEIQFATNPDEFAKFLNSQIIPKFYTATRNHAACRTIHTNVHDKMQPIIYQETRNPIVFQIAIGVKL